MADKYLNVALGVAAVITPLKVDGVVKIAVATAAGANPVCTAALTYEGGAIATLTTTASVNATAVGSFVPQSVAQRANLQKGLWDAIIAAGRMPWNLPVYPSQGRAWTQTFLPGSQPNAPIPSGNIGPTGGALTPPTNASVGPTTAFSAKASQEIVGFNALANGAVGTGVGAVVFASIT